MCKDRFSNLSPAPDPIFFFYYSAWKAPSTKPNRFVIDADAAGILAEQSRWRIPPKNKRANNLPHHSGMSRPVSFFLSLRLCPFKSRRPGVLFTNPKLCF